MDVPFTGTRCDDGSAVDGGEHHVSSTMVPAMLLRVLGGSAVRRMRMDTSFYPGGARVNPFTAAT